MELQIRTGLSWGTNPRFSRESGGDHGNQYTGGKVAVVETLPQPAEEKQLCL
jgi:hypothetical protein